MSSRREELARKAVHVAMGGFAILLRWLSPLQAALCALAALLFNLWVLHPLTRRSLLRAGERERGFSTGIVLYPLAVLAAILVFHRRLELAAGVWGLLAFGDGMATVAGLTLGGPKLPWNPAKTWSGFAAFVVFGSAAACLLVGWVGPEDPSWGVLAGACGAAALAAAFAETLPIGIDDNLTVPLVGGAVLWAALHVEPRLLADAAPALARRALVGAAVNVGMALLAFAARGVTLSGAVWGVLLGTLLYAFAGGAGFLLLLAFFVLGTAATKLGWGRKALLGIAQEKGGRRSAKHAFANVLAGVLFAFLAVALPGGESFLLALAAAFATAAADTVSSEIGQAYGRRHLLVTTFRRVPAGTDGAVSLEGTLAGVLASIAIALLALGVGLVSSSGAGIVVVAAFFGTTLESYLGALLGRGRRIDNEVMNFLNTLAGGLCALALGRLL